MLSLRRFSFAALPLVLAGCLLAGCQRAPHDTATTAVAKTEIKRAAKTGLSLASARLVLPAVSGHPGAAYFTLVNDGAQAATLVAVQIEGAARAEMHETAGTRMRPLPSVDVPPKGAIAFVPGGRHVMAFGLAQSLAPGGSGQITLQFADGRKLSGPLKIDATGGEPLPMNSMAPGPAPNQVALPQASPAPPGR